MRILLCALLLLPAVAAYSQNVVNVEKDNGQVVGSRFYIVNGEPVSNTKYVRIIEGSPFFTDTWMKGRIELSGGRVYDSLIVRLDLLENTLQYIGADGNEFIATTPLKAVTLIDSIFGKEYHFFHSSYMDASKITDRGWYQLLVPGPVNLYKRVEKKLSESKPYGSATVEQSITDAPKYYILANRVFTQVKKINELPGLLSNKKAELNTYISNKKLSGKSDTDYLALISYYNSLVAN